MTGTAVPTAPDIVAAFTELGRIDLRTNDLQQVLERVAVIAKRTIPPAAEVSVTLVRQGKGSPPAATGALASECDAEQYAVGDGPCLQAASTGRVVVVDDLEAESRWPGFTPKAVDSGARSMVSSPLPMPEGLSGALNVYGVDPGAFDDSWVELAQSFAAYAVVPISNAQLYASTVQLAAQLEEAMASRAVIEQAKGFIMGQRRCSAQEAFEVLQQASQRSNRKLRELAEELMAGVLDSRPWPDMLNLGADQSQTAGG